MIIKINNLMFLLFIFLIALTSIVCVSASDADSCCLESNFNDSMVSISDSPGSFADLAGGINNVGDVDSCCLESNFNNSISDSPGSFADLQGMIDNASDGSVLVLDRDYKGSINSYIILNKSLTIDGQGHTIDCLNKKNCFAFYSDNGHIILKNLIISNSRNYNNNMSGALYIDGFAEYEIRNCTFMNNFARTCGGAIYNNANRTLFISNCQFMGNRLYDNCGGAIYSKGALNFVENSTFVSNTASTMGGAIYCDKYLFVINCLFDNNYCDSMNSLGGAIKASSLTVDGCTFKNNRVQKAGGAIYADNIKIYNNSSYFVNNEVINGCGGAMYIVSSAPMENLVFINNKAKNNGGAIYSEGRLSINNTTFRSNFAGLNGGAIYGNNNISIYGCVFESNKAYTLFKNSFGGAIYTYTHSMANNTRSKVNSTYNVVQICSSTFVDNHATKGGSVYSFVIDVVDSRFKNNSASNDGGAIYCHQITLNSSFFEGNRADRGGAIFEMGGPVFNMLMSVVSIEPIRSDSCEFIDTLFVNNSASKDGGAVYDWGQIKFLRCLFEGNAANNGGGVYENPWCSLVLFSQCVFINDTAVDCGGGIYNGVNGWICIDNCTFTGNFAGKDGGAICSKNQLSFKNVSYFEANIANIDGGAIYTDTFVGNVENLVCINNKAGFRGGAIYVNTLQQDIINSTFITNHADYFGGAIYIGKLPGSYKISHCVFIHNTKLPVKRCIIETNPGDEEAIYVADLEYPNPKYHNRWYNKLLNVPKASKTIQGDFIIDNSLFFKNNAILGYKEIHENVNTDIIDLLPSDIVQIYQKTEIFDANKFFNFDYVTMALDIDKVCSVNDTVNVTFHLPTRAYSHNCPYMYYEKNYDGDLFDMNKVSFDVDSNITIVNKVLHKNSVTLQLIPKNIGVYTIDVNFYGCNLSKTFNVTSSAKNDNLNTINNEVNF